MAIVNIQFGQCGNQVGYDLYKTLFSNVELINDTSERARRNSYLQESYERWFYPSCGNEFCARAILIDTEPKVIYDICRKKSSQVWTFNPKNVVCHKDGGSGNNWALGYCERGQDMQEVILECVRREVENCDRLSTIHSILGGAGGTGSGVGSRIIGCLREEYSSKCLINSVIFPYQNGEVVTQNYNIVLTLSEIYGASDMSIIFQNDYLHKLCSNIYGSTSLGLTDLNFLISTKLISFFQPVGCAHNSIPSIVSDLTPHPSLKFVYIKSGPYVIGDTLQDSSYSNSKYNIILKYLLRTLQFGNPEVFLDWNLTAPTSKISKHLSVTYLRCVANLLISRGGERIDLRDMKDLHVSNLYPGWIPNNSRYYYLHQPEKLLKLNKFFTLISNNCSAYYDMNNVIQKAWGQIANKAYLHHYTKYMSEDKVFEAFGKMEAITKSYKNLDVL